MKGQTYTFTLNTSMGINHLDIMLHKRHLKCLHKFQSDNQTYGNYSIEENKIFNIAKKTFFDSIVNLTFTTVKYVVSFIAGYW